jgi:hypothetical protein
MTMRIVIAAQIVGVEILMLYESGVSIRKPEAGRPSMKACSSQY